MYTDRYAELFKVVVRVVVHAMAMESRVSVLGLPKCSYVLRLGVEHPGSKFAFVLAVHCREERMRYCNPQTARRIVPFQRNGDVRHHGIYKVSVLTSAEICEASLRVFTSATEQAELLQ